MICRADDGRFGQISFPFALHFREDMAHVRMIAHEFARSRLTETLRRSSI